MRSWGAEVEPLEHVLDSAYDIHNPRNIALVRPLQAKVKARQLRACHLGPELGGQGYGQVKLALMNEILGRARFGPIVFGCQAPDAGNAEIVAHYGSEAQKRRYLRPLLDNQIVSCFSMTEPQGGADPRVFTTMAELRGDEWVINGEKRFSSGARYASFFIVTAVTDPDAEPYQRMSTLIVPGETPGVAIVRNVGFGGEGSAGIHAYVRYNDPRVPADHILRNAAKPSPSRRCDWAGGGIHHAMRTIAEAKKAFDIMCERVLSRETQGSRLSEKQMIQEKVADSWLQTEQFPLLVLRTAWLIDKHKDHRVVRDIAAVKAAMPAVLHDVASRALDLDGSIGLSDEMPFSDFVIASYFLGVADGPHGGPQDHAGQANTAQIQADVKSVAKLSPTAGQSQRIREIFRRT
jgi:acyl-CoA dehydrogenase